MVSSILKNKSTRFFLEERYNLLYCFCHASRGCRRVQMEVRLASLLVCQSVCVRELLVTINVSMYMPYAPVSL